MAEILDGMQHGNFSFAILVIGVIQIVVTIILSRKK